MGGYCDYCDCDSAHPCTCEELDIDVCQGCGRYYSPHRHLLAWNSQDVAPQLCGKCWRDQGYPLARTAGEERQIREAWDRVGELTSPILPRKHNGRIA